jgi:hypothetical protein
MAATMHKARSATIIPTMASPIQKPIEVQPPLELTESLPTGKGNLGPNQVFQPREIRTAFRRLGASIRICPSVGA